MFKSTEISNPEFEHGNLRFITVKTSNLKGRGDICLFVPPIAAVKDIPIVILLHGVYGSAWVWSQKTGVHIKAWDMMKSGALAPMIIAMPSDGLWGDGSAYMPHKEKDFEKWIVEDVPQAIRENIDLVSDASPLYISGLSMGGFGALRLGIKYADKFKAVSAHSAITSIDQMPQFVEELMECYMQTNDNENSVWGIVKNSLNKLPSIRFDCGLEDALLEHNRTLHQQFESYNIPHVYKEYPGGHDWGYWQKHIVETLLFFNNHMKEKAGAL